MNGKERALNYEFLTIEQQEEPCGKDALCVDWWLGGLCL